MSTLINAKNAFGSVFSYCAGPSSLGTYAALASITSITAPTYSRGAVDVTNYGLSDGYAQFISGGPIRSGSVGISAIYLTTETDQITTLPAAFDAGIVNGWKIQIAGTASTIGCWYGNGIITGYEVTLPQEGHVGFNMTMKVVGKPTLGESTV